jgi:arylformamidase
MTFPWRDQPAPLLEQHCNPRVAVPHFQEALDRYAARSAAARQRLPGVYDLRYGTRPQQTFDLHRAVLSLSAPPLVLFLHGGYWRALDKRDHSFVASLFVEAGVPFANINYDLCPSVTLDAIVDEIREAVLYCVHHAADFGAAARRLFLVGHSAGAHGGGDAPAGHRIRSVIGSAGPFKTRPVRTVAAKFGVGRSGGMPNAILISLTSEERRARPHIR